MPADKLPAIAVGHMNPDADALVGAIAAAELFGAEPAAQGRPDPQTAWILGYAGLPAPAVIDDVAGRDVILVDHSEPAQAPRGIGSARILALVDHHAPAGLAPVEGGLRAVRAAGATCTLLAELFCEAERPVSPPLARAMLCAVLSDTAGFLSTTATESDRRAAELLAAAAGLSAGDVQALSRKLLGLRAGMDAPASEIVARDWRVYEIGGRRFGAGAQGLMSLADLPPGAIEGLQRELARLRGEDPSLEAALMMIAGYEERGSLVLVDADRPQELARALGLDGRGWMAGALSRKKELLPALERYA
ncbi:MAG: DHH family phosphoesterase, partial [Duodenibacillus sp.]|nr:DHH family phosphoesterase [Duodenibacillus sp.]